MPMHGWQKDVLLPSNWFFKKIEWTEMSGKKRRAFEYCSEDGSLMARHKGALIHLLSWWLNIILIHSPYFLAEAS